LYQVNPLKIEVMKKTYLSFSALFVLGLIGFKHQQSMEAYGVFNSERFHQLNSGGASAGNTGAPGESNCTACHSGQVQAGAGLNVLSFGDGITAYVPGQTYTLQLSMQDASNKNGFQLVPLRASDNAAAGNIIVTDNTRTKLVNGVAGKQYLGHRSAGTSVSTWSFDWTAPITDVGNVIFYVATNKTNNNNGTSGDVVRLSQHVFNSSGGSSSLTEYQKIQNSLRIYLSEDMQALRILFDAFEKDELYLNVVNLQGQSVLAKPIGKAYPGENDKMIQLPSNLNSGLYVVNLFVGNKAYSEKIRID
jgi:hypothetical protein